MLAGDPREVARAGGRLPGAGDWKGSAAAMLALAVGSPLRAGPHDWDRIFALAVAERCAPLAWHRSAQEIRKQAPPEVVARWRSLALEAQRHGAQHVAVLSAVIGQLEAAQIPVCVLKGPPLSLRLYGDSSVRASADLDLFIPEERRCEADEVLGAAGWRVIEGSIPWTQTLADEAGDRPSFMEVHSSLADLNLLHLGLPRPVARRLSIDGHTMPVHDDTLLPAYLATHAAKHMPVALIYFVDFLTLWRSLGPAAQEAARGAAERARLSKYLDWALARAEAVERAALGDLPALGMLGITPSGRRALHAICRDIALAATPLDAGRAAAAWLFPPHLRDGVLPLAARWLHRFRTPWAGYLRPSRPISSNRGSAAR